MKTKFIYLLTLIVSSFMLSSCSDSKEDIASDLADLIEEAAVATEENDQDKLDDLVEDFIDIKDRIDAINSGYDFYTSLKDKYRRKIDAAIARLERAEIKANTIHMGISRKGANVSSKASRWRTLGKILRRGK